MYIRNCYDKNGNVLPDSVAVTPEFKKGIEDFLLEIYRCRMKEK